MKAALILFFTCLTMFDSFGQGTRRKNAFTLDFGPAHMTRQDMMFSPFVHTDLNWNVGLHYSREAKLLHKVSLRYGNFNPMLDSPYKFTEYGEVETAYPHSFNLFDIDYLLGKPIKRTEKSRMTIGGLFTSDIQAFNYVYGRISSFGYYSTFGLGIFGEYRLAFNDKNNISATLKLPVAVWLARPPYLGIDDAYIENISSHSGFKTFMAFLEDGEPATWNKLQTVALDMAYSYSLTDKWDLGAVYLFDLIHSAKPQNLLSFRHSLNVSTTIRY